MLSAACWSRSGCRSPSSRGRRGPPRRGSSFAAARAAELEDWIRAELLDLFQNADDATLTRLEDGSRRHAKRRAREMADGAALLRELGVEPHLSDAARRQLEKLDAGP